MKILIADPISFVGHLDYNYGLYRILSANNECGVITNESTKHLLIDKGVPEEAFVSTYSDSIMIGNLAKKYRSKLAYHFVYRKEMLKVYRMIDSFAGHYDAVILTSVDLYTFSLASRHLSTKYIVMDHAIGDVANNRLYRYAWKLVNKDVKLIVFEDYIKEMVNTILPGRTVYTVKHPLSIWDFPINKNRSNSEDIEIFCPSSSNNNSFIQTVEDVEIPDGIHVTIKVNRNPINKKGLTEYNKRVSEQQYVNSLASADYVLLPYNNNYNYRYSGVLLEAIQLNNKVLILNNNTLKKYVGIFPGHIIIIENVEDMLQKVVANKDICVQPSDLSDYEDKEIEKALIHCFD